MSAAVPEGLPVLPHLASEFYAWVWWRSEAQGSAFDLGPPVGPVDVWVDERLAFRNVEDGKVTAVMTGENPAGTLEARAALAGGKVLQEIRLGIRREDREYFVTLKGPAAHLTALKLPQVVTEGDAELVFERMHLYDEVNFVVAHLFRAFAAARSGAAWQSEEMPGLHEWLLGRPVAPVRPPPIVPTREDEEEDDDDEEPEEDEADDDDLPDEPEPLDSDG
ncbi:MAG: hypothetical protein R3F59_15420 [Myxococcota bacterium]